MNHTHDHYKAIRLHLTNIVGLGAVRLLQSLLPAMVSQKNYKLEEVYLPTNSELLEFTMLEDETSVTYYKRYLPNSISRFLECTLYRSKFDGTSPLIVFGDIPIKCKSRQTVFVQNTLLMHGTFTGQRFGAVKYWIIRWLFRRNLQYVSSFIVQTDAMKLSLNESYPEIKCRIHVIAQPVPSWLIESKLKRTKFNNGSEIGLRLFYPAASYPHKNHLLLSVIDKPNTWPVSELLLTIPDKLNPIRTVPWIRCVDKLQPDAILNAYESADALIFLSLTESYGFPLVEAMWLGLPVICPDLPYARILCGEQAIYFDPLNIFSLHAAVVQLNKRRNSGWWPDWTMQLSAIPKDWDIVASMIMNVACNCNIKQKLAVTGSVQ
jgi:glycosyltransferase involved in cell wall biosynthesis